MTGAGKIIIAGVRGVETYVLDKNGADSLTLTNANFVGVADGTITVDGGNAGNTLSEVGVAASDRAILVGGDGADTLIAGRGATMTGGGGANVFEFTTPGTTATSDHNLITDFAPGRDRIAFSDAGFRLGLAGAGGRLKSLPSALFTENATGSFTDASQRFAYDTSTGALYYDAHGDTPGSSRLFIVSLTGDPHLSAGNLFFVS